MKTVKMQPTQTQNFGYLQTATPKAEPSPSTHLRKAVFGGSLLTAPFIKFKAMLLLEFTLLLAAHGQEARFFRLAGPVASAITGFSADGYMTWTNAPTSATFTVQTAVTLVGPSNWVDYIQVPVTNPATTNQLFDPNPPAGMAFIPAGSFTMGNTFSGEGVSSELPLHSVYVSAFYMDRYEVTKALWDDVYQWAINHGYSFNNPGLGKSADHPVHTVAWYDTVKWCNARSEKEGLTPCYYTEAGLTTVYKTGSGISYPYPKWNANGYRLPTEAEWEKAARGGASGRRFPWGNTITHNQANYDSWEFYAYDISSTRGFHPAFATGSQPYTSPVGSFAANGYGLYDMSGNIWEWCWDWYRDDWYVWPGATQNDTRGPTTPEGGRVLRGGNWLTLAAYARCATRGSAGVLGTTGNQFGFRCVRGL